MTRSGRAPGVGDGSLLSVAFAPLAFLAGLGLATLGVVLQGMGVGIRGSLMGASVSVLVHADARAWAFGVFNTLYGSAWSMGDPAMGLLSGVPRLVAFSVLTQLLAVVARFWGPMPKRS
ncbi:MAG TPA: hypothetical protein VKY90_13205 [Candidatus Dormibacteraeota bacterium]|nr:hypothetical protein [Candidatus Dormibacteraeota bacterium]